MAPVAAGHANAVLTPPIIVNTITMLKICYDPSKNAMNIAKHGVSLALAGQMEWDSALVWPDVRFHYGEVRLCGIGYIGRRLFCVIYTDRIHARRIISLRKANAREVKHYAEA